MSLQERTLVVKNFDPDKTTNRLLKELCIQGGPVRNVVVKPDHAFVEYEDVESVGYSKALLDGIILHGKKLIMEPKVRTQANLKYTQALQEYIRYDKNQRAIQQQQQQMLAYQQQQQLLPRLDPPTFTPTLQYPINFVQAPDPTVFDSTPQVSYNQPNYQPPPSTSVPKDNFNLRRSNSLNHGYRNNSNRNNRSRNSDWTRRK